MHPKTLLCLPWIAGLVAGQEPVPQPAEAPMTIVVAVDCELARDRVWLLTGISDDQVVDTAARVVRKRCAAMGVPVEVAVDAEQRRLEIALPRVANPRQRELAESMVRSIGLCEFFFLANAEWTKTYGIDIRSEREKLEAWKKQYPGLPLEFFNTLDAGKEGPHPRISWISLDPETPGAESRLGWPLLLPASLEEHFGAGSFERTFLAEDSYGKPAIGFELRPSRQADFERATKDLPGQRRLAMVLEGRVVAAPKLEPKLATGGLIEGRFTPEEARRLFEALQKLQGPLRIVEIR